MSRADVVFGLEVIKLGDYDDDSPWRMTVDCWDARSEKIVRYQLTGRAYNGWPEGPPERTLDDLARVQVDYERRDEIAAELDRLDREAIAKISPIMEELFRAQAVVLHGPEVLEFLDRERDG
jgi:hypothetical protein